MALLLLENGLIKRLKRIGFHYDVGHRKFCWAGSFAERYFDDDPPTALWKLQIDAALAVLHEALKTDLLQRILAGGAGLRR